MRTVGPTVLRAGTIEYGVAFTPLTLDYQDSFPLINLSEKKKKKRDTCDGKRQRYVEKNTVCSSSRSSLIE